MMKKSILVILSLLFGGVIAQASLSQQIINAESLQRKFVTEAKIFGILNWKVGETTDHSLKGGFIQGDMHTLVREEITEGFWLQEDINAMGQKIKAEVLVDKNTGEILQLIVNGEKQETPAKPDVEVIETKNEEIRVPKGTFQCLYVKLKDRNSGDVSQLWLNNEIIPITGMAKTIQPSQFGEMTLELTNFHKL